VVGSVGPGFWRRHDARPTPLGAAGRGRSIRGVASTKADAELVPMPAPDLPTPCIGACHRPSLEPTRQCRARQRQMLLVGVQLEPGHLGYVLNWTALPGQRCARRNVDGGVALLHPRSGDVGLVSAASRSLQGTGRLHGDVIVGADDRRHRVLARRSDDDLPDRSHHADPSPSLNDLQRHGWGRQRTRCRGVAREDHQFDDIDDGSDLVGAAPVLQHIEHGVNPKSLLAEVWREGQRVVRLSVIAPKRPESLRNVEVVNGRVHLRCRLRRRRVVAPGHGKEDGCASHLHGCLGHLGTSSDLTEWDPTPQRWVWPCGRPAADPASCPVDFGENARIDGHAFTCCFSALPGATEYLATTSPASASGGIRLV